jgi:uncharacterized membrane protein
MDMSPVIAVHLTAALSALVMGPVALWARRGHASGQPPRTRLHRAAGYAWVTLMLMTALSALFIRDVRLPNLWGYTPIHLLIPVILVTLYRSFRDLATGKTEGHRQRMQWLYFSACVVSGAFTLLPQRYLGQLVWGQWLGLL